MLTVKDKKFVQTEKSDIEKLLSKKMNDLSDSVDCFDRISEQVFSESLQGIEDSAYVVTELENITGKSQAPRFLKWAAVAAAAVAAIVLIPDTNFGRQLLSDVASDTDSSDFKAIVREIDAELSGNSYRVTDVSLDYYIKNDILVTPLFCCPFEDCGRDDANVRIFTKQIDGIDTTQVYAVLYSGTYTENNFIAAAESKYNFMAEDMAAKLDDGHKFYNSAESALEKLYYADDKMGCLYDETGSQYSAGAFDNTMITKNEQGEIVKVLSEIIIINDNTGKYQYDIIFDENGIDNFSREKMWGRSLYFNGNSSFPVIMNSDFEEKDLIQTIPENQQEKSDLVFIYPFEVSENPLDSLGELFTISTDALSSYVNVMPVPKNPEALITLRMYIPAICSDREENLYLDNTVYQNSLDTVNDITTSREQQEAEYKEKMAEMENLLELERLYLEEMLKKREAEKSDEIRKEAVQRTEALIEEIRQEDEILQKAIKEQQKLEEVTKPIGN